MARKSLYDKFVETVKFAKDEKDPKIRDLLMEAATDYYKTDIKAEKNKTPIIPLIVVLLFFIVIISIISITIWKFGLYVGIFILVISFSIFPFIIGLYLRMSGKLTESGLITLYREGGKTLLTFLKILPTKGESAQNEDHSHDD